MSDKPFQTIRQVPVVIVGAGPTGITAATLLAQYGVESMVLERWTDVYPQPRAVHLDDEIYRVIARLGIADEFAAISRPTQGLRLLDNRFNVLTEFHRNPARSLHGFPQANMFDQPELETLLRANLKRYAHAQLRGGAEVIEICDTNELLRVTFTDRSDGRVHHVDAEYVLGCDGANSMVRSHIGSTMADLNFQQRWLVVDVATECDLAQWDGVYQVCDPFRAATYMRIGQSRYRWEFQLRPGERTEDFNSISALRPLIAPWTTDIAEETSPCCASPNTRSALKSPTSGAAAKSSSWGTQRTSLPRSSARHRSRTARRDEPQLEDCRRPMRHSDRRCP